MSRTQGQRARRLRGAGPRDTTLLRRLQVVHAESRRTYGRPRLRRALRAEGIGIGDRRVRRLMNAGALVARGRRRYRVTADSTHTAPIAANHLARAVAVARPNRVRAGDITALWTGEGWLYLAVLLDLASRHALARRRIRRGLLHHSDRGVQYASARYQAVLRQYGIRTSMSRKGNCWDNSVVESFFRTLKTELHPTTWATRAQAQREIADYIERFTTFGGCIRRSVIAVRPTLKLDSRSPYDPSTPSTKSTHAPLIL